MVFITHQLQGSYLALPSTSSSWNTCLISKRQMTRHHSVKRKDRCLSLKQNLSFSFGAPLVGGLKVRSSKVSSCKCNAQNDKIEGRGSGSKSGKNSAKVSYLPNNDEEAMGGSLKTHTIPLSYAPETDDSAMSSPAIHRLFQKWLTILRTESPSPVVDEVLTEGPPPMETSESPHEIQITERSGFLKVVWSHLWKLDATMKIPLLLFIPSFLAVNAIYGAKVSKELTPFWLFGPLVVALYIKLLRALCALYVYTFKKTIKNVKKLPNLYLFAYNYIAHGKLEEDTGERFWQPLIAIRNMDYREVTSLKLKELREWIKEKHLDYVESIWPYYCQTIRFLKRANFV